MTLPSTNVGPGPPTNVKCLVDPLDISLEISWTAPTNPNGVIVQYQININPGKMDQANITSVATKKVVDNLIPGMLFVSLNIFLKETSEFPCKK